MMQDYRHVLIAVNESRGPLNEGLKLALEECSWVTVLKVLPPYEGDVDLTGVRDIDAVIGSGRHHEFIRLRDAVYDAGVNGKVRIETGEIAESIVAVANEEDCDLIIMGTRQDTGFISRFLGGNLVDKVTRLAPCPVMVVNTEKGVARPAVQPQLSDSPVPAYQVY